MMSIKADRVRLSHRGPFRGDCRLVPSSEKWSGWKAMARDTEVRERGGTMRTGGCLVPVTVAEVQYVQH